MSRWARRLLVALAGVVLLAVALLLLLQVPPVATWAGRRLAGLAPLAPGSTLDIGRVSGSWIGGLALEDVVLSREGRRLATIRSLRADYDLGELLAADRRLDELVVEGARIHTRRENGRWDLAEAFETAADTTAGGGTFAIGRLVLRDVSAVAELTPDSVARVEALELRARDLVLGDPPTVVFDTLTARLSPPTTPHVWLTLAARGAATPDLYRLDTLRLDGERSRIAGRAILPRDLADESAVDQLDVALSAAPLALADVAPVVPALAPEGELELEVRASAEGRRAIGRITGRLGEASLTLDGATRLGPGQPAEYHASGQVRALDPSRLLAAAPAGRLNADLELDLAGPALDQADGRAELRVRESSVGETEVADARLRATVDSGRADLDLQGGIAGARLALDGWARPFDSVPSYRLAGTARDLPGTDSLTAMLAGREGSPSLEVGFRAAGRGTTAETARVTGRATFTAVREGGERTPLGGTTLEVARRRVLLRPELLAAGGRIAADVRVRLADTVSYELRRGTIDSVDLGRLLGDTLSAPLTGRFSGDGRGTAPDEAVLRADLALDELRYGARRIERVTARIGLDRGQATLALRGGLQGGVLSVNAQALPFDSTPLFEIRRAALDSVDLGTLLGQPAYAGPFTARLTGSGAWGEARREFRGRLRIEPSRVGQVAVRSGVVNVALAGGRLRYDGTLSSSAGAVAVAGDGRPLDEVPAIAIREGTADSLDLGALLGREGLSTSLDARFTASAPGGGAGEMGARLALELLPSRVNQAEIRSGRAGLALERGALRGELRLDAEDGDLVATLRGTTSDTVQRLRIEGALRVDRLARWTGDTAVDGNLASRFTLEGAADSLGILALAGTVTANGAIDSVRLDTLQVTLSPGEREIRLDTLVVRSNVAAFDGGGRVALRGGGGAADTLRVLGALRDPMPLMALAGTDTLSLDSARVALAVWGPASRRLVRARGAAHRALYAGSQIEELLFDAGAALDSAGLSGAAVDLRAHGAATGGILVTEAHVVGRYDSLVALRASARLRDTIAIDLAFRGTAGGDTVQGTLERLDISEGERRWALERPAALRARPPRFEVDYLALRGGESRFALDGVLDRSGTSDLSAELRGFDLAPLHALGLSPMLGTASGRVRLTGPPDGPTLDAEALADVRTEEEDIGRVGGKMQWTAAGLALEAAAEHPDGRRLTVAGTLPLRLTLAPADTASTVGVTRQPGDTLGLTVHADSFNIEFFQPFIPDGVVEDLTGALAVDARVSGTMEKPLADGNLLVRGFEAMLPAINVRYQEGEVAARLGNERLAVERLRLVTDNGGELTATGEVGLAPLTDPALSLDATLREFRVSHSPTLRTVASGRLALEGTVATPVLTGELTLGRTDIIAGTETGAAANVEEVELTEADLQQLAREFGPAVLERAEEGLGLVDRFRLDLDVRLPSRVWFRQRGTMKSDIEVFGRVRVRQEPGEEMGFFGRVEPVPGRGVLELYGREFRLQQGEITLNGPVEALVLDVTAQYLVPTQADPGDEGILIDVNATGSPDSLELAFSSEPAMSQEDIVSYIVTGRPASENPLASNDAGEGPGAAEAGAEVALGALSESVAGAAGEALGLDVFQIRQDGLRGLTLTAGRYIASRLFLSLQQPIQLSGSARESSASLGPGFELEYTARRWLRANLRGGNVEPRFFLRGRHAF